MTLATLQKLWNSFWFEPCPAHAIALFRIFYGCLAFIDGLIWIPDLFTWLGHSGTAPVDAIQSSLITPRFSLLLWLNPSDTVIGYFMLIYLLSAVCVIIGLGTRFNLIVVWLLLVSFMNRNPYFWHHCDSTLVAIGLPLIFSPAGKSFSIDRWLTGRQRSTDKQGLGNELYEPWAQRLIQIYMAAMYWCAFWGKLNSIPWLNGTAVYYVAHLECFQRFSIAYLANNLWVSRLLTWSTLVIEFSLWSLIWFKEFRYWVLLAGIVLHLSINYCMDLDLLEYAMIACYITFVDPNDLCHYLDNLHKQLSNCFLALANQRSKSSG